MLNPVSKESVDLTQQNIEKLKELFPEILTDGNKVDFDMLQTILGEEIDGEKERYSFTWPGKRDAIIGAQQPSKGTLRPNIEKSKDFDTTENLYIEGDNLEVLKLLQKSYNNKVKVIYIDPPYNTGKDFVYKDNFRDSVNNYLEQTRQSDSEGNLMSTNSESNGRFHTDWLNMIYPRLRLSRNLLSEDGVIFISVDDIEYANLKKICDEVFGERNLVSSLIWEKKYGIQNDAKYFSTNHDYLLVYARNKEQYKQNLLPRTHQHDSRYTNRDDDPRGPWKAVDFTVPHVSVNRQYAIHTPSGRVVYPSSGRSWNADEKKIQELMRDNRIWFGVKGDSIPSEKRFLSEVKDGVTSSTIWKFEDVGHTDAANRYLKKLFDGKQYFDYPKTIELIIRIITLASTQDSIILDFFSGSSTTAEAVMEKNSEDGGNRKFIMVQLPENLQESSAAYKDGFRNITDIAIERIKRAGDKIVKEKPELVNILDTGFKYLELDKSNIKEWNTDFDNLEDEIDLFSDVFVEDRKELDVVYEIMLKNGLELTLPINSLDVNGKTVYDIAFGLQFICLEDEIDTNIAKAIINKRDEYGIEIISGVVFKDAGFNGNDSEKLNCIQLLKDAGFIEENLQTI